MMPQAVADARTWRADLLRRLGAVWYIKATGTPCWIALFFTGYFWVLRNPMTEPTIMPFTPIDRLIGFHPEALGLYVSLWVYVSLPPALVRTFRDLFAIGVATAALSLIGLAIFYLWPSAVPHFEIDMAQHPSLSILKGVDMTGNACPSLHVAFALYSAVWLDRILREMRSARGWLVGNWLWCAGIVLSTMATRQHVLLDVLAGTVLGLVVALAHVQVMRTLDARRVPGAAAATAGS